MVRRSLLGLRGHGLLRLSQGYRAAAARRRLAEADGWPYVDAAFGELVQPQEQFRGADLHTRLVASTTIAPLPCYLRAEDRNASAHSVEARVPLLDHRLVELCMKLPVRWKMRDGWNKYIFREAMRDRIPESVRSRRVKFGFPTDVSKWFTGRAAASAQERVLDGPLRQRGWVQAGALSQAFNDHAAGRRDHSDLLFNVVQLSHWLTLHDAGWARPMSAPVSGNSTTVAG
jgi:asparagine synthase (glutamine-hydrolysing)